MQIKEIVKKAPDGEKYKIQVAFRNRGLRVVDVEVIDAGKRKGRRLQEMTEMIILDYRSLSGDSRRKAERDVLTSVVPEQYLKEALEEAWLSLKPNGEDIY